MLILTLKKSLQGFPHHHHQQKTGKYENKTPIKMYFSLSLIMVTTKWSGMNS